MQWTSVEKDIRFFSFFGGSFFGLLAAGWAWYLTFLDPDVLAGFAIVSAPLGFFGVTPALFGAPFFWGIIGWLLTRTGKAGKREFFFLLMTTHYFAAPLLVSQDAFGGWESFLAVMQSHTFTVVGGLMVYGAANAAAWVLLLGLRNRRELRKEASYY